MRILLICQQSAHRYAVPAYQFWENYFKAGLAEAGHSCVEIPGADWARGLALSDRHELAAWRQAEWSRAVEAARAIHAKEPIGLVLSYLFPQQVEPAAIAELRALGLPCVNFFCDNVREFTRVPEVYRPFDLHWVPEAEARTLYRQASLPFVYAPMPVWIDPALRTLPERESNDVIFIGSHDLLREALFAEAVATGLKLKLHGPGWTELGGHHDAGESAAPRRHASNFIPFLRDHGVRGVAMKLTYKLHRRPNPSWLQGVLQGPVFGENYFRLTRESAVTLGVNRYPSFRHSFDRPGVYSRLRDIEAPMLGACYLTEAAPGLEDLFEPGREIETYRDAEELAFKAAALSAEPARRRELRARAQRRALAEHSVAHSIDKITRALGLAPT